MSVGRLFNLGTIGFYSNEQIIALFLGFIMRNKFLTTSMSSRVSVWAWSSKEGKKHWKSKSIKNLIVSNDPTVFEIHGKR